MRHRVGLPSGRAVRIGRVALSLVAVCGLAVVACSHPGGSGVVSGTAGTTGSGGNTSLTGTAGTGNGTGDAGTTGAAGDVGTTGTAGTTGSGGDTSPTGTAGTSGDAGTSGTAGTTGGAGTGEAGTSGGAGTTGSAGTTGAGGTGSGNNLIENGDFSGGATNWHTESGNGNVNNGAYCVGSPGGATLVGYAAPAGTMLSLSGSYKLTFQASGGGTVHVKVGMAVSPYTADYEGNSSVNSSPQTFTHMFTANDNNAGIAFTFMNAGTSTVCLDNVTLVQN
jgi:hypothetical protein